MNGMRTKEIIGMAMLGEGIMGLAFPEKYSRFWAVGPKPFKDLMNKAADHPGWMRAVCAAEAGLGFWLAAGQLYSQNRQIGSEDRRSFREGEGSSMREIDGRLVKEPRNMESEQMDRLISGEREHRTLDKIER